MSETQVEKPLKLAIIDFETTGLNPKEDLILEVACIVVDAKTLEEQSSGSRLHKIIDHGMPIEAALINKYVYEMHQKSGLVDDYNNERKNPASVTGKLIYRSYLDQYLIRFLLTNDMEAGKIMLSGSSIQFDRGFIREQLPYLDRILHYRMVDASSFRTMYKAHIDPTYTKDRETRHRAMSDCEFVLDELRYFTKLMRIGHTTLLAGYEEGDKLPPKALAEDPNKELHPNA